MTVNKIRKGELKEIIEAHSYLFKDYEDADFATLAFFLYYEKIKGNQVRNKWALNVLK